MQVTPSKTFKYLLSLTRLSKGWMQASPFAFASKTFVPRLSIVIKWTEKGC